MMSRFSFLRKAVMNGKAGAHRVLLRATALAVLVGVAVLTTGCNGPVHVHFG